MSNQAATAPTAAQAPAVEESTGSKLWGVAKQMLIVWAVSQAATRFLAPKTQPSAPAPVPANPATSAVTGDTPAQVDPRLLRPAQAYPAWELGQQLSMHVYFSTSRTGGISFGKGQDAGLPQFVWENITFGDWSDSRTEHFEVDFPKSVQNNGTLWADIYLVKNSSHPDPRNAAFHPENVHHIRKNLTPYLPKDKIRKERSLLSAAEEAEEESTEKIPDIIAPHWHTNLTLALISEVPAIPYAQTAPPMLEHIHLVSGMRDETGTKGYYKPIIFPNEFWQLRSHMIEVNTTTPSLPITITYQPMSFMKFQLFSTMTHGFNEAAKNQGGGTAEFDEIKRMLLETNPWFLGLTALVSVLHMVFEMLAFKNDVSHWREKKEMVGVSVRTIVTNVFVQVIILLYLIDNNTDTSWMIIFGSGMGAVIEAWKITKAVDISVKPAAPGAVIPYRLDIKDKHVLSEDEKKTQEFDKLAFRYVGYATVPLLAGYTVYSLLYETHRGWYSFVISTLTSFVYMFGFAQLVPQLIINYKLKSVSHMPMKSMIYKTLSTVVDDLFAFCIKMPILHRLSCFRDDVVFAIFLYQRWIYRIDPKRINEYGQVMATDGEVVESKEARIEAEKTQGVTKKTQRETKKTR